MNNSKAVTWNGIGQYIDKRLDALQAAGDDRDRLIIDPGLGYYLGSNRELSLRALAGIRELTARYGVKVLICQSRKSFLGSLTGKDTTHTRTATLAAEIYAAWQGAATSAPMTTRHCETSSQS